MSSSRRFGLIRKARLLVVSLFVFALALSPLMAQAGREGVYLSENVYFTLENVRISSGSDDEIVRFTVKLHNGGSVPIDYNYYGVRVVDADGYSYSARLIGKQNARVQPGAEQGFPYEARVAKGLTADQLRVVVFGWSFGGKPAMNDLGSFSVAAAIEDDAGETQQAIVQLAQVDGTLSADASVGFRIGNQFAVYENDEWNVYVDLIADNRGDSGFTLPAALKMRLENADGETVEASAIDGQEKAIVPGESQRITVKAAIPGADSASDWTLQFYSMNGDSAVVLDSLGLTGNSATAAVGDTRPITDSRGQEIVGVKITSASILQSGEGQWVRVNVQVTNTGSRVVAVPQLSASFQTAGGGVAVAASDSETHPAYLSQGDVESFSFAAQLPKGIAPDELQMALFEKRGGSASGTGGSGGASSGGGTSSASTGASGTAKTVPVLVADLKGATVDAQGSAADYTIGDPIRVALDHNVEVSVLELKAGTNENYDFKTAVAKVSIANYGKSTMALPDLRFDLVDESGRVYSGTKQAAVIAELPSNSSYLLTYSFVLSDADESKPFTVRLYDGKDTIPLGSVKTMIQQENTTDDVWEVSPYRIEVRDADLLLDGTLGTTFAYEFRFHADVQRLQPVITDASVSKLQFELLDGSGLVLSSQTLPFLGGTKLLDGDNSVKFSNLKVNQYSSNNYVKVYEIIDTPNGIVKRELGEIR
jgi:hypothetical protein